MLTIQDLASIVLLHQRVHLVFIFRNTLDVSLSRLPDKYEYDCENECQNYDSAYAEMLVLNFNHLVNRLF